MRKKNQQRFALEQLEDRLTPSFDMVFNPANDTWTLTQVADDGAATIGVDGLSSITVTDGAGAVTVAATSSNLTINMMDNSQDTLTVDLDTGITGNLTVNLGNGGRTMNMAGDANSVGGNMSVTGGTLAHTVTLSDAAALVVGGNLSIDLGTGSDTVSTTEDVTVGGSFTMRGVNAWTSDDTLIVGGNLSMSVNTENVASAFDSAPGMGTTVIGGSFTYRGGNENDDVNLSDSVTIGSNVSISLANDITAGSSQLVDLDGATIGGSVTILGGTISGFEDVESDSATTIGGNIYINTGALGSPGDEVTLAGTVGGSSVTVLTSLGNDSVSYEMIGNRPRVFASLSLGDDTFTLGPIATTSVGFLYIDFGFGSDTWNNNFGAPFSFPAILRNLP